ncbi:hypothetical protein PNK_1253 [Candidatus Protochlamydia naegleriophila]|uniref:Uncharacterized protein n=1 Tax=Candidatus Protochlamydia naegleriophila TaxID=389348 RepID=A0A0U5JGI7_9BACT|nr:hypothetical protein PNK_1253 [Candidatus Protochlamydia naegleriophila]
MDGFNSYRLYAFTNDKGEKTIGPHPDRTPFIRKLVEMCATGNHSLQTLKTAAI